MNQITLKFARLLRTVGLITILGMLSIAVAGHESIEECPSEVVSAEFEFIFSRLDSTIEKDSGSYLLPLLRHSNGPLSRPKSEHSFFILSQRSRLNGVGAYLLI